MGSAREVWLVEDPELVLPQRLLGELLVLDVNHESRLVARTGEERVDGVDVQFRLEQGIKNILRTSFALDLDGQDLGLGEA